jgi:NAD(P) transhydrogenase subunit alpha
LLITAAAVQNMRPGSVIVDLAAEAGGNCELCEPGSTVVKNGVTIAGPLNLPSTMPQHASMLYAKNVLALLTLLVKDGTLTLDMNDEIVRGACVTRDGEVVNEAVRSRLQGVGA